MGKKKVEEKSEQSKTTKRAMRPQREQLVITLPMLPNSNISPNKYEAMGFKARMGKRIKQRELWLEALANFFGTEEPLPYFTKPVDIQVILKGPTVLRTDPFNWSEHKGIGVLINCLSRPRARKIYGLGIIDDDSAKYIRNITYLFESGDSPETILILTPIS